MLDGPITFSIEAPFFQENAAIDTSSSSISSSGESLEEFFQVADVPNGIPLTR
jgi:hypothetical protein